MTNWLNRGLRFGFPIIIIVGLLLVLSGTFRKGQIAVAAAQLEQARQNERQLRLRIGRDMQIALADWESAFSRVRALRQNVAEAEQVLTNERLKFEAGHSVINFVLDAEAALLTSQSLFYQA